MTQEQKAARLLLIKQRHKLWLMKQGKGGVINDFEFNKSGSM